MGATACHVRSALSKPREPKMTISSNPIAAAAAPLASGLRGAAGAPGDKSVSHRALLLGGMAEGETLISGLLESADVLNTAKAVAALGADVTRTGPGGAWRVVGVGAKGFSSPKETLDFGNAGTGSRLAMGVVAGYPISATFDGDASLRSRPMERVLAPLRLMGAEAETAPGGKLPLVLRGQKLLKSIEFTPPQASAQVKSAILLAGLHADGVTLVDESHATRDHSENMLRGFGARVDTEAQGQRRLVRIWGGAQLKGQTIATPGDPSSAAFLVAAALLIPGSDVRITGVMLNPTRTGLFDTLKEMGADLSLENIRSEGGEPAGDLIVRHSQLKGVTVPPDRAPSMIDEYPILSVLAAFAEGETRMLGVHELRVKESDRIALSMGILRAAGVTCADGPDELIVTGKGAAGVDGWGLKDALPTHGDHRIAMSGLVLGLASRKGARVAEADMIATSFPDFFDRMESLGASFAERPGAAS